MREITDREDQVFSYYSTAGGSMFPFICWNERIIVKKVDPRSIEIGDIVLFSPPKDNLKVAHRVVKKKEVGGRLIFQTRGDHNKNLDESIDEKQIMGKVVILERKNQLFSLPSRGGEFISYKASCFYFWGKQRLKKVGAKIFLFLQSSRIYRWILGNFLNNKIEITMEENSIKSGSNGTDCKSYKFKALLLGLEVGRGFLSFSNEGAHKGWWMWSLGVEAPFRGMGIGKRLVEELIKYLKKIGAQEISLNVNTEKIPAIKLYESLGFKIIPDSKRVNTTLCQTFVYMRLKF